MRVTRNLQFSRCKYDDANTSMARSRIDAMFPEYESRLSRIGCMRTSATGDEGEIEKEKSAGRGRRLRPGGLKGANIVNGEKATTTVATKVFSSPGGPGVVDVPSCCLKKMVIVLEPITRAT
ncbi:Hypothetical protein NTJ_13997 [Nesidiocoris tenuis]|uniref:Uncharacterized protein n=1 Tax=Nesidiocoris tenuis TaxID=355587 RepID=A0ABN7B9W6_9HEMI|nr:Hypothetical protein NTJ_13997 [Nesidiocoris tenuis]